MAAIPRRPVRFGKCVIAIESPDMNHPHDKDAVSLPPRHAPPLADELLIDAEAEDMTAAPAGRSRHPLWLALSLVLIALNLRPALASLAPVLADVIRDTGITAATASILTTAPVLCLGLAGPLAPVLARRFGAERVIFGFLLLLAGGIGLRGLFSFPGLLTGSIIAGCGIGVIGVLLPGLVKRDFPDKAAAMTGIYTMALCAGAAGAAGTTIPLETVMGGGWSRALAFWALPALLAAIVWLWHLPPPHGKGGPGGYRVRGLWRDPLAWQVTLFMGLQSSLAYSVFGWLAPILRDRGVSPAMAGAIVSASVMVQLVTALTGPMLANRGRDQRPAALGMVSLTLIGLMGCLFAPIGGVWLWAAVLGLGQGGAFAIALTLIVLRSRDSHVAAHLSSMAQSVGYSLASMGPLAVGLLHDRTGGWNAAGGLFIAISIATALAALGAGRALYVKAVSEPR